MTVEISLRTAPLLFHLFIETIAVSLLLFDPLSIYNNDPSFSVQRMGGAAAESLAMALIASCVISYMAVQHDAPAAFRYMASMFCMVYHVLLSAMYVVRVALDFEMPGPGDFTTRLIVETLAHVPVSVALYWCTRVYYNAAYEGYAAKNK
jgi:hypothetical protein